MTSLGNLTRISRSMCATSWNAREERMLRVPSGSAEARADLLEASQLPLWIALLVRSSQLGFAGNFRFCCAYMFLEIRAVSANLRPNSPSNLSWCFGECRSDDIGRPCPCKGETANLDMASNLDCRTSNLQTPIAANYSCSPIGRGGRRSKQCLAAPALRLARALRCGALLGDMCGRQACGFFPILGRPSLRKSTRTKAGAGRRSHLRAMARRRSPRPRFG